MGRSVSATEARVHFGELVRRVGENGETVVVERGGKPAIVVMPVAEYARLRDAATGASDWRELLNKAHAAIRAQLGRRRLPNPVEVIRKAREERDEQLMAVPGR